MSKNKRKLTGRYDPTRRVRPAPPVIQHSPHVDSPIAAEEVEAEEGKATHVAPVVENRFDKVIDARQQPVANQKRWGKRKGGDK